MCSLSRSLWCRSWLTSDLEDFHYSFALIEGNSAYLELTKALKMPQSCFSHSSWKVQPAANTDRALISKLDEVVSQLFIMATWRTVASKMCLCWIFFILFFCRIIHNCKEGFFFFVVSPLAQNEIFCFNLQVLHLSDTKKHVKALALLYVSLGLPEDRKCVIGGSLRASSSSKEESARVVLFKTLLNTFRWGILSVNMYVKLKSQLQGGGKLLINHIFSSY